MPSNRRERSTERRICSPENSPVVRSLSALVASTTSSGRPPVSSSILPRRRSLSPSPYEAAVSRKLIELPKTALSVSLARSSSTEKSKVSGMSPSGAHPTHNGETESLVPPRILLEEGSTTLLSIIPPVWVRPLLPDAPRPLYPRRSASPGSLGVLPSRRDLRAARAPSSLPRRPGAARVDLHPRTSSLRPSRAARRNGRRDLTPYQEKRSRRGCRTSAASQSPADPPTKRACLP